MIFPDDFEDIKRSMELPADDKNIEPEDWIYKEDRQVLRFGTQSE